MSVVDLCFFVAEHDDHHLRTIDELRSALRNVCVSTSSSLRPRVLVPKLRSSSSFPKQLGNEEERRGRAEARSLGRVRFRIRQSATRIPKSLRKTERAPGSCRAPVAAGNRTRACNVRAQGQNSHRIRPRHLRRPMLHLRRFELRQVQVDRESGAISHEIVGFSGAHLHHRNAESANGKVPRRA